MWGTLLLLPEVRKEWPLPCYNLYTLYNLSPYLSYAYKIIRACCEIRAQVGGISTGQKKRATPAMIAKWLQDVSYAQRREVPNVFSFCSCAMMSVSTVADSSLAG